MLLKTGEDKNVSIQITLQWVVNSKTSLTNVHGFLPYNWYSVLIQNCQIFLQTDFPALEEPNISKLVADNLRSARKAFVASESSEKLTRALKHNLWTYQDAIFVTGDTVYYKRRESRKWKGPGKVIDV